MTSKPPRRIQRKRIKDWRLPPNTKCVDRSTKWGNPYKVEDHPRRTPEMVVRWFREDLLKLLERHPDTLKPLRGKNLACWCPLDQPCHADVLLELANIDQPAEEA